MLSDGTALSGSVSCCLPPAFKAVSERTADELSSWFPPELETGFDFAVSGSRRTVTVRVSGRFKPDWNVPRAAVCEETEDGSF